MNESSNRVSVVGPWSSRRMLFLILIPMAALALASCQVLVPTPTPTPRVPTGGVRPALTPAPNVAGNPENGRLLFTSSAVFPPNGCATCHTLRGLPEASSLTGPNLTNITLRPTLGAGAVQNTPDNLARWIMNPGAMKQGAAMPPITSLTEQQARDLAAFLYSQPYNPVR